MQVLMTVSFPSPKMAEKPGDQIKSFPGVPANTYVSDIMPSKFDENVVYASFDNRKRDDFKPYLLMSSDKGKTWKSISANLPENGTVHTLSRTLKIRPCSSQVLNSESFSPLTEDSNGFS